MLKRLPTTLGQVKEGDTFENLLNQSHHIIYSVYRAKEITKNKYDTDITHNRYNIYGFKK